MKRKTSRYFGERLYVRTPGSGSSFCTCPGNINHDFTSALSTMSESMDFSDMFRRTDGESAKQATMKSRTVSTKRASAEEMQDIQENVPPAVQQNITESDSMVYVKNTLRNMNHDLQSKDLSPPALQAIEMLFSEVRIITMLCFKIALTLMYLL